MRNGHTLYELLAAITMVGAITGAALPGAVHLRNHAAVRAAGTTLRTTLASARNVALARSAPVLLMFDTARASATITVGPDTILDQPLDTEHHLHLSASRNIVRYGPTGRAYGASNTTLIVQFGTAADTITVSRLGRVRGNTRE